MARQSWLTFEAIKDLQSKWLNLTPQINVEAASGGLNEDSCNGLIVIDATNPGLSFTLEDDKTKVGANALFVNNGANDYDIVTAAGNVTVASGQAVLLSKISDVPQYCHIDFPVATVIP